MTATTQFVQSFVHYALQGASPLRKQGHTDLPLVAATAVATDIAMRFQAIDQANGTMVSQKQAVRQLPDSGFSAARKAANGKEHLVLLGLESCRFSGTIAAPQKLANATAEFCQCGVFGIVNASPHKSSISCCDINASRGSDQRYHLQHPSTLSMHLIK